MNRRVLITGSTGFIGRHCLRPLEAAGYEVHAVTSREALTLEGQSRWHRADLLKPGALEALVTAIRPTHLLHFAWYAIPGKYPSAPENLEWSNATANLLAAFAKGGGERAVFAGSCFEYDFRYGYCNEELTPSKPGTFYGVCKNATRQIIDGFSRQFGTSSTWARIFHLYGPHEPGGRLVPAVVTALLKGEVARCTHGQQVRDFLYVEDVAEAFVALLGSDVRGTVNIGSGAPISLRQLIDQLTNAMDVRGQVEFGALDARADDPPVLVPDIRRLREEVGWQPRWTIERGMKSTVDWWRTQR